MAKLSWEQYDQLKAAGWDDEKIEMHATKRGLDMPSQGILKSIAKDVTDPFYRLGQFAGMKIAKGMGASEEQVNQAAAQTTTGFIRREGIAPEGERLKQFTGEALKAGSYALPYGRIAKAAGAGLKGLSVAGAVGGYTYEAGQKLSEGRSVGEALTPGMTTAIGAAIPGGIAATGFMARQAGKGAGFLASQATGLSPQTIKTLITRPSAVTEAQRAELSSLDLAKQFQTKWKARKAELMSTGKGYDAIRNSGKTVDLGEDVAERVLGKYGLQVQNGKVVQTSKSQPIKDADVGELNSFLEIFGGKTKLGADEFLNARAKLDDIADWDASKSNRGRTIAREIRAAYDEIGKKQIGQLATLDAKYSTERKLLDQVRSRYFNKDGSLKPSALSRISTLKGKNKDIVLEEAEKIMPGIEQQVQLLNAVDDIAATQGQKVGTYTRGFLLGGAGVYAGNPVLGALAAIATMPNVAVPIIKAYGTYLRGPVMKAADALIEKLGTGQKLTSGEEVLFRNAVVEWLRNTTPGDQMLDSKLGQKAIKANQEMGGKMGMSIKDVSAEKTAEIASRMDGNDFVTLENYIQKVDAGEPVSISEFTKVSELLDTMGINPGKRTDESVRKAILDVLSKKEQSMTKVPITSE